jgi:dihydrofolate reductase
MRLSITIQVSVDGVMQGNGGLHEIDRRTGFERGGWARPLFDSEAMAYVDQLYQRADAFLFGRRTYDVFASYWGTMANEASPIAAAMNTRPKYVASTTLTNPAWAGTTVLGAGGGDLAAAIRELRARPGGELQLHGSGTLARWLLEHRLVDELNLLVCPVVVGDGVRLFPERGLDMALEVVESRTYPKGITLLVYRPGGRPEYTRDVVGSGETR